LFTEVSHCLINKNNITLIETKVTPKNKRRRIKKNKNANENCDARNKRDDEVYEP